MIGMGAVHQPMPAMGYTNANNRVLRGFSMPPLARANLGMAGVASADVPTVPLAAKEHNKTQMYMGQHRCRMALRCEMWVQYLKMLQSK